MCNPNQNPKSELPTPFDFQNSYEALINNMHEAYALHELIYDYNGLPNDLRYLRVNKAFENYTGLKSEDLIGKTVLQVFPKTDFNLLASFLTITQSHEPTSIIRYSSSLNRYYRINAYNAGPGRIVTLFDDITETQDTNEQINYLNYHDQLTGLYNRSFVEASLIEKDLPANLPFSIIMADVNGLKLTNDAFGHVLGDKLLIETANALQTIFRDDDIIARVGGDEFLILLPRTSNDVALSMTHRLNEHMDLITVGPIKLSVSIGTATKNCFNEKIQYSYKKAEDRMYHHKLTESQETRSDMIRHIFDLIKTDYTIIDKHQHRVKDLALLLKATFTLNDTDHQNLIDAALHHDVGLIAVDNELVNKASSLDENDWTEVKRHSECGFRILSAITEYAEIAEIILAHHEWYDGSGYPKQLKGKEIPYLSRILSIIDSFDAMTHERFYKRQFTKKEAIQELRDYSGTQFDPDLVELFINGYLSPQHL